MSSRLTAGDLQVITRVAIFRGLRSETVEHVIAPATGVMLKPHEGLFRQGDPATAFFIVIDGWIKLYRITPSGEETVIHILTKGGSFAEAVAFTGNRYPATAEAVTDARVARVPADHVVRCIRESPDIALAMVAILPPSICITLFSRSNSSRRKAECRGSRSFSRHYRWLSRVNVQLLYLMTRY